MQRPVYIVQARFEFGQLARLYQACLIVKGFHDVGVLIVGIDLLDDGHYRLVALHKHPWGRVSFHIS
jgi:hypothetical protein